MFGRVRRVEQCKKCEDAVCIGEVRWSGPFLLYCVKLTECDYSRECARGHPSSLLNELRLQYQVSSTCLSASVTELPCPSFGVELHVLTTCGIAVATCTRYSVQLMTVFLKTRLGLSIYQVTYVRV